ncbi:hypothetical protein LMG27198_01250 [Methylocystis echinoides]|uniref:Uncharacterized protein n=1 Tax=Methylocystis echinoides TaxID=29468 RepID=A0A9W6LQ34_9HYPH|nr:hypothetical protein LMG27198_01250 [Methylocystis echinoides]
MHDDSGIPAQPAIRLSRRVANTRKLPYRKNMSRPSQSKLFQPTLDELQRNEYFNKRALQDIVIARTPVKYAPLR